MAWQHRPEQARLLSYSARNPKGEQRGFADNYLCELLFAMERDGRLITGAPTISQYEQMLDILENCVRNSETDAGRPRKD
jgi:hypothetical protein